MVGKKIKIVFVAGPLKGEHGLHLADNINEAEKIGGYVVRCGAYPIIPHANTRNFFGTAPEPFFYDATLEVLRRCDAIALCARWRDSKGALNEEKLAREIGLTVFDFAEDFTTTFDDLLTWVGK